MLKAIVRLGDFGKAELKAQFVELRAKGYSYARIAKRLKVAKGTLANWSQELEALQEESYLLNYQAGFKEELLVFRERVPETSRHPAADSAPKSRHSDRSGGICLS